MSSDSTPCSSRFLMRPVTMFALPSAGWLLFFSSPSRCSQVVMRSSIFNSHALKQGWLASLSHFRVTVWLPKPPNRSATRVATHSAAPFPGNDHCQGESVFRPVICEDRVAHLRESVDNRKMRSTHSSLWLVVVTSLLPSSSHPLCSAVRDVGHVFLHVLGSRANSRAS